MIKAERECFVGPNDRGGSNQYGRLVVGALDFDAQERFWQRVGTKG